MVRFLGFRSSVLPLVDPKLLYNRGTNGPNNMPIDRPCLDPTRSITLIPLAVAG